MNTEPYITFQKFNNPDEASEFETLFKKNNIDIRADDILAICPVMEVFILYAGEQEA